MSSTELQDINIHIQKSNWILYSSKNYLEIKTKAQHYLKFPQDTETIVFCKCSLAVKQIYSLWVQLWHWHLFSVWPYVSYTCLSFNIYKKEILLLMLEFFKA
jgi:hypothetical protein